MIVSEFIERRKLMERVDKDISLERVLGLLRMVYLRRRFHAARAGERLMRVAIPSDTRGYPAITVEGDACSPNFSRVPLNIDSNASQGDDGMLHTPTASPMEDYFDRVMPGSASAPDLTVHTPSSASFTGARRRLSFQANDSDDIHSPFGDVSAWNSVLSRMSPTEYFLSSPFADPPQDDHHEPSAE